MNEQAERAAFETAEGAEWQADPIGSIFERTAQGNYVLYSVEERWQGFKMRARLAALAAAPTTKEGTEVKVGQVWEDMDKRMNGRRCRIYSIEGDKVVFGRVERDTGGKTKVSISRLRPISGGWKLVA